MKEYKYTINGNKYEVAIGDIVENIATITVNGEEFKVEMEKEPEPEKKVVVKPAASAAAAAPADAPAAKVNTGNALKAPLPGVVVEVKVAVGDEVNKKEGHFIMKCPSFLCSLPYRFLCFRYHE